MNASDLEEAVRDLERWDRERSATLRVARSLVGWLGQDAVMQPGGTAGAPDDEDCTGTAEIRLTRAEDGTPLVGNVDVRRGGVLLANAVTNGFGVATLTLRRGAYRFTGKATGRSDKDAGGYVRCDETIVVPIALAVPEPDPLPCSGCPDPIPFHLTLSGLPGGATLRLAWDRTVGSSKFWLADTTLTVTGVPTPGCQFYDPVAHGFTTFSTLVRFEVEVECTGAAPLFTLRLYYRICAPNIGTGQVYLLAATLFSSLNSGASSVGAGTCSPVDQDFDLFYHGSTGSGVTDGPALWGIFGDTTPTTGTTTVTLNLAP